MFAISLAFLLLFGSFDRISGGIIAIFYSKLSGFLQYESGVSYLNFCLNQVARDKAVKNWTFIEGIQYEDESYGSGYPSGKCSSFFSGKSELCDSRC